MNEAEVGECAGYLARVLRIPYEDARRIVGNAVKTRSGRTRVGAVAGRGVFRRELLRVEVDRANAIVGAFLGMSAGRSTEEAVAEWFGVTESDARRMCVRVRGNGKFADNGCVGRILYRADAAKHRRFLVGVFGKRRELTATECMQATSFIKCVVENGGDWLTEEVKARRAKYFADNRERECAKERERMADPEYRASRRQSQRESRAHSMECPEYRERVNARRRARERERCATDPEYRERSKAKRHERLADPEWRARENASARARYAANRADPEWAERNRAYHREWARNRAKDPEWRERRNAKDRARRAEAKQAAAC